MFILNVDILATTCWKNTHYYIVCKTATPTKRTNMIFLIHTLRMEYFSMVQQIIMIHRGAVITCTPRSFAFLISERHTAKLASLSAVLVIWHTPTRGLVSAIAPGEGVLVLPPVDAILRKWTKPCLVSALSSCKACGHSKESCGSFMRSYVAWRRSRGQWSMCPENERIWKWYMNRSKRPCWLLFSPGREAKNCTHFWQILLQAPQH